MEKIVFAYFASQRAQKSWKFLVGKTILEMEQATLTRTFFPPRYWKCLGKTKAKRNDPL